MQELGARAPRCDVTCDQSVKHFRWTGTTYVSR